jgi:hypothetical protein
MPSSVGASTRVKAVVFCSTGSLLWRRLENGWGRLFSFRLNNWSLEAFGFRGEFVVLGREQVVQVADCLEEDIQTRLAFHGPEYAAVLEPCMGENTMKSPEYVHQVFHPGMSAVSIVKDGKAAREELLI